MVARFPLEIKDQYEFNPNFSQAVKKQSLSISNSSASTNFIALSQEAAANNLACIPGGPGAAKRHVTPA